MSTALVVGTLVRFRETGATGHSLEVRDSFPFDGDVGPWHYVDFGDLQCWVTAGSLEFLTVFGWI